MTTRGLGKPETLADFQAMNESTYGEKNRRDYGAKDLVARLGEEAALLQKVVRKGKQDLIRLHLAHIFSWYNAAANGLALNVHKISWHKYPGRCSYCLDPEKCVCGPDHPLEPPDKDAILEALRLDREGREPRTLAEHQAENRRIYGEQHAKEDLWKPAAHIVEEVAEVSAALRHNDMEAVADEMADVLSRIFSFANRLGLELADVMRGFYPYKCWKCKQEQCACEGVV